MSKVYSSILSIRINDYCDFLDIIVDEQNGFRNNRSCVDHIHSITTILNNFLVDKRSILYIRSLYNNICLFIQSKAFLKSINAQKIDRVSNNE